MQFNLSGKKFDTGIIAEESTGEESMKIPFTETVRLARDRENILAALLTNGKMSGEDGTAELLVIKPTTLASRMKALGVEKPR